MHGIHDTDCMSRRGVIDPDLLRNFLRVAETGSFTRAAEQAGRTQSTISMQVSRLEAVLGRKVFSRSKGTTVRLTGDGSRLFTHAKEMLAVHDAIWDDFHMLDGPGREAAEGAAPDDYALPLRAQREAFTAQVMLTLLTNEKAYQDVTAGRTYEEAAAGWADDLKAFIARARPHRLYE